MSTIAIDEGARAKLARARYHLLQLQEELSTDGEEGRYGVIATDDLIGRVLRVRFLLPRHLFIRYSILAGEVVGHARSALDHIVWRMVPSPINGVTGFPVFRSQKDFDNLGMRKIDGLSQQAVGLIRNLQPFDENYEADPLWVLNELWNWDKHRLTVPYPVVPQFLTRMYEMPSGEIRQVMSSMPPNLHDGMELTFHHPPFYSGETQVRVTVISSLQFTEGPAKGQSVSGLFPPLVELAEQIVDALVNLNER